MSVEYHIVDAGQFTRKNLDFPPTWKMKKYEQRFLVFYREFFKRII